MLKFRFNIVLVFCAILLFGCGDNNINHKKNYKECQNQESAHFWIVYRDDTLGYIESPRQGTRVEPDILIPYDKENYYLKIDSGQHFIFDWCDDLVNGHYNIWIDR